MKSNESKLDKRLPDNWSRLGEWDGYDLVGPKGATPLLRRHDERAKRPKLKQVSFAHVIDMAAEDDVKLYVEILDKTAAGKARLVKHVEQWDDAKHTWRVLVAGWEFQYVLPYVRIGNAKTIG